MKYRMQCSFLKMFVTRMCSVATVFSFIATGVMYLHGCVQVTVSRATGALYLGRLLTKARNITSNFPFLNSVILATVKNAAVLI